MIRSIVLSSAGLLFVVGIALLMPGAGPAGAAQPPESRTLILYDPASGIVPEPPLLSFAAFPTRAAAPLYDANATVLDTMAGADTFAGWVSNASSVDEFPMLDPGAGFHLDFTVQVESESHSNGNRAGFSVIVLGRDLRGIELGFWENDIWAQGDNLTGGLFKHAEGTSYDTTADLVDYRVTIQDDGYALTANGNVVLSGPLRDYTAFEGFPDPYQTPSFIFLGDDTTSARARLRLGLVSITGTEPIAPAVTSTPASTITPPPTASITPIPSGTPIPSPTPLGPAPKICSGGWIILMALLAAPVVRRKSRVI